MSSYYSVIESPLFIGSPIPQVIVDPLNDIIEGANNRARDLFWSSSETLTGQAFSLFFGEAFDKLVVFTQAVLEQGHYWSTDLSIVDSERQRERNLEINATVIGEPGTPKLHLYLQYVKEIDRKRATAAAHKHYLSGLGHWKRVEKFFEDVERDNQLILNAAGEGIYGVDAKGCTTFVNPVAEELLGWSAQELVGEEIHKIIHHSHEHGEAYEKACCPIYAAFKDGTVHRVLDEVFWCKDGSSIPVEYTSTPIMDNGYLVGAVVVFRDVTKQKKSQQSLIDALNEVESLKRRLEQENAYLQQEMMVEYNHHEIVGNSAGIQKVIQQIEMVGPTDATVLITGESGTGKELVARAIHEASERRERPLIRVNCAAIPREIFESEFFGHVRGAFTGAVNDRVGRFEIADGGTIFLDEVGELPYDLQGKLLRVLQEQQFERVGEAKTRNVDVRVIAATNQDMLAQVEQQKFRNDLYFRLNVFPVELPPLRDRAEDIPLLAMSFLNKTKQKFKRPNLQINISQMAQLSAYHWPGNIRELQNVIERQVIVATQDNIVFDLSESTSSVIANADQALSAQGLITESEQKRQNKAVIIQALERSKGKVSGDGGAAALLAIKPTTLASRIKKYGIDPRSFK